MRRILRNLLRRSVTPTTPLPVRVDRPACPFYGFVGINGMLMDCRGNGCGLAGGHTPCRMEMAGEKPAWKMCARFNHEGNRPHIEKLLDRSTIFPEEMHPPGERSWDGIPLRKWYDRMLDRN